MISFKEARKQVLQNSKDFGTVNLPLEKALGRVLAESIYADRDFPPFHRATKDGIAIAYDALIKTDGVFSTEAIAPAGSPQKTLQSAEACIEVMTGAVVPMGADTVVMYEHLEIVAGKVKVLQPITKGQNIHYLGTDASKGDTLLQTGKRIGPAEIGILASVGKTELLVKKNPSICVVSTGNELVPVSQTPEPHEIRRSNVHTLKAALQGFGLKSEDVHLPDDENETENAISQIMEEHDIVILSGGVSKGKYDYLPKVFDTLGVQKVFHKVQQRPGKPFWFGVHHKTETTFFAFPGNPASTFANYHLYFIPWLKKSLGLSTPEITVILEEAFENQIDLTRFLRAKAHVVDGTLSAMLVKGNGSGDLTSLSHCNGFVQLEPSKKYNKGAKVVFVPLTGMLLL